MLFGLFSPLGAYHNRVNGINFDEYLGHDSLKAYVCILYASPCAPLLVLWPGEVEWTSLAMMQGKASPVPAPAPMFRVSAVLRRYDADWTPTCRRRPSALTFGRDRSRVRNNHALQSNPRTPHAPLSARIALERVVIAHSPGILKLLRPKVRPLRNS